MERNRDDCELKLQGTMVHTEASPEPEMMFTLNLKLLC